MRIKHFVYGSLAILILFAVAGCETVPKKFKEEVAGIKSRVENLETKVEGVESKQSDIERMTGEQGQAIEELKVVGAKNATTNVVIKHRPGKSKAHVKEIQVCLKNAGFYSGKIDGVKGRNTRKAIREFQKANGLKADGVVGNKTWELLSKYESGSAAAPTGTEEGATK